MSNPVDDSEKRKPAANQTIQIDLSQVQLVDPGPASQPAATGPGAGAEAGADGTGPNPAARKKTPPPLPALAPPGLAAPGAPPAAAQAAPASPAKTIGYVALIVVLVAVAIAGGLAVGRRAHGNDAPAASETLTIPPIEVK